MWEELAINTHTNEANTNPKQILTSSKTKRNQNTFWAINNTGTDLITLNIDLSENYIKVHRCSVSLVIRDMQTKLTMGYHYTTVRMAKMRKEWSKWNFHTLLVEM